MPLSHLPFDAIAENDLLTLVTNAVPEGIRIDYKRDLYPGNTNGRKEFLRDVTAFANSRGGYLVVGVAERKGSPTEIVGIKSPDPNAEIEARINALRDSVRPRLAGVEIRAVPLRNGSHVLVVRVPRSWAAPHQVTFQGDDRFYIRNGNVVNRMDADELKAAYLEGGENIDRLRRFHDDRLSTLLSDQFPIQLEASGESLGHKTKGALLLQVVPLNFRRAGVVVDMKREQDLRELLLPYGGSPHNWRHNADGFVTYRQVGDRPYPRCSSYAQIFRDGGIETATRGIADVGGPGRATTAGGYLDPFCVSRIRKYLELLKLLQVPPPFVALLGLCEARGINFLMPNYFAENTPIERDRLSLPEVLLESYDVDVPKAMKPLLDALWNASGWQSSPFYDGNGRFKPDQHG